MRLALDAARLPAPRLCRPGTQPALRLRAGEGGVTALAPGSRPLFVPGTRLQFDAARDRWVVQAPERLLLPDEIALEILKRCDGATPLDAIVDDLATTFGAAREEVDADVRNLLGDRIAKRIIET